MPNDTSTFVIRGICEPRWSRGILRRFFGAPVRNHSFNYATPDVSNLFLSGDSGALCRLIVEQFCRMVAGNTVKRQKITAAYLLHTWL